MIDRDFPKGWEKRILYDVADWTNGRAFKSENLGDAGTPVIKIAELKNGITDSTKFADFSVDSKYEISEGDTLFAWSGSPDTSIGVYRYTGPLGYLNQHIFKVEAGEGLTQDFLHYLLMYLHPGFVEIARDKQTTGLGHVTQSDLKEIEVGIPPMEVQEEIASILRPLDRKLTHNRKTDATLEELARTIFRSWFVDFAPVHTKADGEEPFGMDAETAELFPDSFEESEIGQVPEGWNIRPLDEIAEFLNGTAVSKYRPNEDEDPYLKVIKIREMREGFSSNSDEVTDEIPERFIVEDGDILFSWSGSLICRIWTGGTGALNQHIFKVSSEGSPKWFIFESIKEHLPFFRRIASSKATTMGHINRGHLSEAKCVIPPTDLLREASKYCDPLYEKRVLNDLESRTLSQLRDLLLPRLISGDIPMEDLEEGDDTHPDISEKVARNFE